MAWADIRDAVQAAVVLGSGLAASAVMWKWQDVNQPQVPYIALSLGNKIGVGLDGVKETYDASRPAGKEFKRTTFGIRETNLVIEAYTPGTVSNGDSMDSEELLEQIRSTFYLDGPLNLLAAQHVSTFDLMRPIQTLPTLVTVGFRGRSVLEIGCYVPAPAVSEYAGYIAKVSGKFHVNAEGDPLGPRDIPFTLNLP